MVVRLELYESKPARAWLAVVVEPELVFLDFHLLAKLLVFDLPASGHELQPTILTTSTTLQRRLPRHGRRAHRSGKGFGKKGVFLFDDDSLVRLDAMCSLGKQRAQLLHGDVLIRAPQAKTNIEEVEASYRGWLLIAVVCDKHSSTSHKRASAGTPFGRPWGRRGSRGRPLFQSSEQTTEL